MSISANPTNPTNPDNIELKSTVAALVCELVERNNIIQDLERQVDGLNRDVDGLVYDNNLLGNEKTRLIIENDKTTLDRDRLRYAYTCLSTEYDELKQDVSDLMDENKFVRSKQICDANHAKDLANQLDDERRTTEELRRLLSYSTLALKCVAVGLIMTVLRRKLV